MAAAILYNARTVASRQQQSSASQDRTVNIQTGGGRAADGAAVVVSVDRSRVHVGETVVFTLTPAAVVTNPRYTVTVEFGDGTRRQVRGTQLRHSYRATGHYKVYASVVGGARYVDPDSNGPTTAQLPRISLSVNPTRVSTGTSVNFRAQLSSPYPNLKYRFSFGDGSNTAWQSSSETNYTYRSIGTYAAYVDIGLGDRPLGGSVRQKVSVVASALGPVDLAAYPSPTQAGLPVTLSARVVSSDSSVRYRFNYGDTSPASGWQNSAQTTHVYAKAGTYPVSVDVAVAGNGPLNPLASARRSIQITPPSTKTDSSPSVSLSVNPAAVERDKPVSFNARVISADGAVRYRFVYGDGSARSGWQSSPQARYSYRRDGKFSAYVEIARAGRNPRPLARSEVTAVTVGSAAVAVASPSPSPRTSPSGRGSSSPRTTTDGPIASTSPVETNESSDRQTPLGLKSNWWWYLLLLLLLFAGYCVWRWIAGPTATVAVHPDIGNGEVSATAEGLSLDSEVILHPHVADARYDISMTEPVVKNLRRENA